MYNRQLELESLKEENENLKRQRDELLGELKILHAWMLQEIGESKERRQYEEKVAVQNCSDVLGRCICRGS